MQDMYIYTPFCRHLRGACDLRGRGCPGLTHLRGAEVMVTGACGASGTHLRGAPDLRGRGRLRGV